MRDIIRVNENDFSIWLMNAWMNAKDGWDRGYWYDPSENKCISTCETKNTEHNPTDELILVGWVNGDNNFDYNAICYSCSAFLSASEENASEKDCDVWEDWRKNELKYTDNPQFTDMQFECMENVGWYEDFKNECEENLKNKKIEIEWV